MRQAPNFAIIAGLDFANCYHFRLGLAHPLEPVSIADQEALRIWRQIIEPPSLAIISHVAKSDSALRRAFRAMRMLGREAMIT